MWYNSASLNPSEIQTESLLSLPERNEGVSRDLTSPFSDVQITTNFRSRLVQDNILWEDFRSRCIQDKVTGID